jgi:hypothetical protein
MAYFVGDPPRDLDSNIIFWFCVRHSDKDCFLLTEEETLLAEVHES